MARPKAIANLSPEELKKRKADLAQALKQTAAGKKEVEKAVALNDKAHAAKVKEATKAAEAAKKAADKAIAEATKAHAAAAKRHGKELEAAEIGLKKINDQLAALTPATADA